MAGTCTEQTEFVRFDLQIFFERSLTYRLITPTFQDRQEYNGGP